MHDPRKQSLSQWVAQQMNINSLQLLPVSGDASFRRYFRFECDGQSYIAVDAPPEHENNQAFSSIARLLESHQLNVPQFLHLDLVQGFIVISDLGDRLLLSELTNENVGNYYAKAFKVLLNMQAISAPKINDLPVYDSEKLNFELSLFQDWFLERYLSIDIEDQEKEMFERTFSLLVDNAIQQPQTFVHRDFHSRNLMLTNSEQLAVIDFQDAVTGPLTYDLVSLLRDCYIEWPDERVDEWCNQYWQNSLDANLHQLTYSEFKQAFDWMGMQRHIKVLGIFCRLNYRDSKSGYLKDLPLTYRYVKKIASHYPEFSEFNTFLESKVEPHLEFSL